MAGDEAFEFLFMLIVFGGIFGIAIYVFGRAFWEQLKPRPKDPDSPVPSTKTSLGSHLTGIAAGLFLLWLFGSLFLGMLGFDTGFK